MRASSTSVVPRGAYAVAFLVLLGALCYANSFSVPFVFDDKDIILANPAVRDISALFSPERPDSRILGYLSFALNYRISGYDASGYHLLNLVIHLLNGLLVYRLVPAFFRIGSSGGALDISKHQAERVALVAGLLFLMHPLQTQAVTYLSQRFASLATLFYLAAVTCYAGWRSAETGGKRAFFYCAALSATVLAMHTKEIAFTIPLMLVLCEAVFPDQKTRRRLLLMVPFLLTMAMIPAHRMSGTVSLQTIEQGMTAAGSPAIPQAHYMTTQLRVLVTYLRLIVFPFNQSAEYEYPVFTSPLSVEPVVSALLLCLLLGSAVALRVGASKPDDRVFRRLVAFGIFWFFLSLAVESSVIPIADVMFEHRMYLPMAGVSLAIASGFEWFIGRSSGRTILRLLGAVLLCFGLLTVMRNHVWGNELRLWEDTAARQPRHARVRNNLGVAYLEKGRTDDALRVFSEAVAMRPGFSDAYYNLGNAQYARGDYTAAIRSYKTALSLKADEPDYRIGLGNAYFMAGEPDRAAEQFRSALLIAPESAVSHNNLGSVLLKQDDLGEARREFESALRIKPDYSDARRNLEKIR